ncbi:MAG TPA: hypothetical protein VFR23_07870 [Jiangellaceae bacterium]|nr:hypothetical protein [Jiangellaceae bacterium]
MDIRTWLRVGGEALAMGAMWKSLRQARADGDKLRMFDAIVHALAIATAIALVVREVRQERTLNNVLDLED